MQNQAIAQKSEGVNFIVDSQGNRIAVVIDLERYGDLLEDFFDVIISKQRLEEDEKISLSDFKKELISDKRLVGDV